MSQADQRNRERIALVNVTLPFPPSANRYWRKTKLGRVYVSTDAKQYRDEVWALTIQKPRLTGDVALVLRFYRPRKSGDLDNRIKILVDALQLNCLQDDSQVAEIHAYRYEDKQNPRVEVEIATLDRPVSPPRP